MMFKIKLFIEKTLFSLEKLLFEHSDQDKRDFIKKTVYLEMRLKGFPDETARKIALKLSEVDYDNVKTFEELEGEVQKNLSETEEEE